MFYRCILPEILLKYNVNPPSDPFDSIYCNVILPRPKECTLPWQLFEKIESTTNPLDSVPLLEKCRVQLALSRSLTLESMIILVEKLKRFVDAVGYLHILVGSCRSHLLKEYIKLEMQRQPDSTPSINSLKTALTATNSLVTKIVNGNATIAEVTANETITLDELNLDQEFNILAACAENERPNLEANFLKRALDLFQLSSDVSRIEPVCRRYGLHGCLNDPTLNEVVKIAKDSNQERCSALTLENINDKYKQAYTYLRLKDEKNIKCLEVFKRIDESADFYKFVEKKLCSGEQGGIPSPKQVYRFLKLCDFISELHRDKQFAQHILGCVKVAFHYILPFMNKEQTFQGLMSAVTELEDTSNFSELKAVTNFMDDIQGFFSTSVS